MEYLGVFSTQFSGERVMMGLSGFEGSIVPSLNNHAVVNSSLSLSPPISLPLSPSFCLSISLSLLFVSLHLSFSLSPSLSLSAKQLQSLQLEAPAGLLYVYYMYIYVFQGVWLLVQWPIYTWPLYLDMETNINWAYIINSQKNKK